MQLLFLALGLLSLSRGQMTLAQVQTHLAKVRTAAQSGSFENLRAMFTSSSHAQYLETMVGRPAGLRSLSISAFPAPPGYEKFGDFWLVFHRYQQLEAQHDVVVPFVRTADGVALGGELPEDLSVPYNIESYRFRVKLMVNERKVAISAQCNFKRTGDGSTIFMRMNDAYVVSSAKLNGKDIPVLSSKDLSALKLASQTPQLLRAGGVLYLTNAGEAGVLELNYGASLNIRGLDKTVAEGYLLTSYWYPHIGRRPAKSQTTIEGPKDWLLMGTGNLTAEKTDADTKTVAYKSDVATPFYHVVAGPYKLAAEVESRGRKFRAWHLNVEEARAKRDVATARDAVAYFEDRLGKFPYDHYDVVDTPDFYGVECYSFTVLTPRITEWATSHEIAHTYFGGLAPNTYIRSIWNEGLAQYMDSALFRNNSDGALTAGYASRSRKVALSQVWWAHGPDGLVGYMRGAQVFKMLENELGSDVLNKCLRKFIADRAGRATEWSDLEKSFSTTAGKPLDWFFDQWVRGAIFPRVSFARVLAEPGPRGGFNTNITADQTGTLRPFRLRFELVLQSGTDEKRMSVLMENPREVYDIASDFRPARVSVNPIGWTLADVPAVTTISANGNDLARR